MITLNDVAARPHLTDDEISRLEVAGARKVVLEQDAHGAITAIACWMQRGGPQEFFAVRLPWALGSLTTEHRGMVLDHVVRRVGERHAELPMTDDELDIAESQRR